MPTILVSCVQSKASSARPAGELYRSAWFRKARAWARATGDRWFVLSALHGLVDPDRELEPYNLTLNAIAKPDRDRWAARVLEQIRATIAPGELIVILAGERYRETLEPELGRLGYAVEVPLRGMGIGEQMHELDRRRAELAALAGRWVPA